MSSYARDHLGAELALRIGGPAFVLELRERVRAERRDVLERLTRPRRISACGAGSSPRPASVAAPVRRPLETIEQMLAELWDQPRGAVAFSVVSDRSVDPSVVHAARIGRTFAAAHLGMAEPLMGFYKLGAGGPAFRRESDANGRAHLASGTIAVRADLDPRLAAEVAAHEVYHLTHGRGSASDHEAEAAALAYGEWALDVLEGQGYGRRRGIAGTVHVLEGMARRRETLAGVARHGDVLVAREDSGVRVYWNMGASGPDWIEYFRGCPSGAR